MSIVILVWLALGFGGHLMMRQGFLVAFEGMSGKKGAWGRKEQAASLVFVLCGPLQIVAAFMICGIDCFHKRIYKATGEQMSRKARIIKRTGPDGQVEYIIQQKHGLFRWWWVDAWLESWCGASCRDYFDTLDEAKRNLCYFDGTETKEEVVFD